MRGLVSFEIENVVFTKLFLLLGYIYWKLLGKLKLNFFYCFKFLLYKVSLGV